VRIDNRLPNLPDTDVGLWLRTGIPEELLLRSNP
jgi:hypothetical protein